MTLTDGFSSLVAQTSVGIVQASLDGRIQMANEAFCRLTGRDEAALLGQTLHIFTHPDDIDACVRVVDACVAEGHASTIEKRYVHPDGTIIWAESAVSLVRDLAGAPQYVMSVTHDITRRKAIEQDLIDAKRRYELIGRATNDVIWDWDQRTGVVWWSESLRTVLGYAPSEAAGTFEHVLAWWSSRIHPEDRDEVVQTLMDASRGNGETWAKEYRFLSADGRERVIMDRGYVARDSAGVPIRMVGSMQDITELRAERRKLETILARLPVAVIVADMSGRLTYANAEVERIWRHPFIASSSVPEYRHWKGFYADGTPIKPEDWPLARALMHRETVESQAIRFERGDGTRGVLRLSATPIDDAAGNQVGAVVVFADVTEQEDLFDLTERARRDAEEASRMKDEFLAVLSHELRTPLNAIVGWAHMLSTGKLPADRGKQALDTIERNARAQSRMIEDLLDVSAIVRGKLTLDRADIDLRSAVVAACETVRPAAMQKEIALEVAVPGSPVTVYGDHARLQQVVWNLVFNALKFTPPGGRIEVTLSADDERAAVAVNDTGAGIAAGFLPFVFDRFRQGEDGATRLGGLGLGLSIVRHLTEAHEGTVSAHSDGPGTGASFTVVLPLKSAS